jgi:hypothetical protein
LAAHLVIVVTASGVQPWKEEQGDAFLFEKTVNGVIGSIILVVQTCLNEELSQKETQVEQEEGCGEPVEGDAEAL